MNLKIEQRMQFCYEESLKEFNFARRNKEIELGWGGNMDWSRQERFWIVDCEIFFQNDMNILASGVEESFRNMFYYCGGNILLSNQAITPDIKAKEINTRPSWAEYILNEGSCSPGGPPHQQDWCPDPSHDQRNDWFR